MTIPVTLNTISNLQDTTTAQTNINANSAAITGGFSTALNVIGDQMKGNLDMNSNQILNLPAPATANSPVRLVDVTSSSSIASVPPVGTSGAVVPLLNTNNTWSGTQSFGVISSSTITASTINGNLLTSTTINASNITSTNLTSTNVTLTGNIIFNSNVPWVDIRAYGALSGIDNSSSIQAAINFLSTNYGGGRVLIPNGDWTVSSGITIKSAVILQGVGRSISVIDGQTGTVPTVSFDSSCAFAGMRDLSVLGQASATSVVPAVSVTTSIPIEIQNCDFKLGSHGMSTRGSDGKIVNSTMYGYSGNLNSVGGSNWYELCGFDSGVGGTTAGIAISSISGGAGVENQFTDCDVSGSYTNSISIADVGNGTSLTKFVGCVISAPIVVSNAKWTAFDVCEIGNTTITLSSSGGVVTVTNCYGFASTVINVASGATKVVSGCYQVS